ncbi:PP2C family protein-serine/threonine phosphatase [Mycolicibacterium sp. 120266]|jgi:serine/threonine protein phosphatase PrpC|uniref:PP2C family protein-serine/threonine phosphatase n=1 Tax=Mycolicibacterium sp. 120266 TaxID=3090601 RepID=UPI00299DB9E1|nr:PP2C family protein-serine/threonine phosphatase [Mycolicibacterium sp. 120266]MDX1872843.1 PP2C family protein-serine/threonine phosphatase [Mycolicibacterium sp. 120266]
MIVVIPRRGRADGPCTNCGAVMSADGYCPTCGQSRAEPDRDEASLGGVAMVTDRGVEHARNEDAGAVGILAPTDARRPQAIAVVICDGVSTSINPQLASGAAARAGVTAMLDALSGSQDAVTAMYAGLAGAAAAPMAGPGIPGSCTFTAVIVLPGQDSAEVTVGNVGDSRSYWLPDPPAVARQLTVDDSLAQELIAAGAAPQSEAVLRGAHTLTHWLGADAEPTPWTEHSVQTLTLTGPGALVVCSDGLWNYLPEPDALRAYCTGTDAVSAARALTDHALDAGGADNITVAVLPIGPAS